MATITPTVVDVSTDGGAQRVTWATITAADSAAAVGFPDFAHFETVSVQATGTFDSGSVAMHGTIDGTNFAALTAVGGTSAFALSAAGIKGVNERTLQLKPVITGGTGAQSITVTMLLVRSNPMRT